MMDQQNTSPAFDTMTEALTWLKQAGYEHDFNLDTDCIRFGENHQKLMPADFQIDKVFRFEGQTDPGDENIIYAISAKEDTIKGTLINAFGVYPDPVSDEMIKKLSTH
ncbi:phosphoribosylpyrophosphate synthetase [Cytophagaceae bacterium DM2B3-1]|uniref:Phosphoribosylpyrophosphate synthetase n=1 Tax=Xanthocytophaga flava TaxID=3048013 RepID=A0ABT7CRY9_9BACT|nr:phosphoribosylpyrophosphate synthetase [Xanthocytophaga flavus]MDJ1496495.1 phosphoribosylpyrophosphate synthetase [Xanthocytophaga flavus]